MIGFFCLTGDSRYIIKTLHKHEMRQLMHILPRYYEYMTINRDTLIIKILGCFEVQLHIGFSINFIIINNVFDTLLPIHERFDLKGSWVNRKAGNKALKLDSDMSDSLYVSADIFDRMQQQLISDSNVRCT